MTRCSVVFVAAAMLACSGSGKQPVKPPVASPDADPDGPHRAAIAAQLKPYLDGEIVSAIVVGVLDAGKLEIYGFGTGPGGKPPTGRTVFDVGTLTQTYAGLLLADSVQRREIDMDAPVAELLPPGVTVPVKDTVAITPKHLALHSSGLPRFPPSLTARKPPPDPFAGYTDDVLLQDLIATQLEIAPGTQLGTSYFGAGLLGYALGRKLGNGNFGAALQARVLAPLELRDTAVAPGPAARRALGTDDDLKPTSRWTWGALVGAGGMSSTVRDQLHLIEAELDAASGSKGTLRGAMRLTQEAQLDTPGDNVGLGWLIDSAGRPWHEASSGGFRGFVGFDPKTRRGVVVLAATQSSLVEVLGRSLFDVLDGSAKQPALAPSEQMLGRYAGKYNFTGTDLAIVAVGKRLYLEGPGEPRHRMVPFGDRTFWIEALQSAAKFDVVGDQVKAVVFKVNGNLIAAPRVP